jgi:hypothetical protein
MIVVHGQMRDKQVTIPAAIAARLSIERKAETTANTCTALEHDFHGLGTNQSRYGIARITVDEHCAATGLWSPRVRQHIEQYARLLENKGVRLEQLDAWSDALAEFQLLQQGSEASEAMLDDRKRTAELAETVMRQGVDYLLFFELRCDVEDDDVDVFGTAIDLGSFSLRPKSGGGAETDGLRNSRLHTAPRARVREALDVVLGDLFHVGHVLLVDAPSGERDEIRHIRVAAEFPAQEQPNLEVAIFRVKNRDICDRLESINSLARDRDLGDLRAELGNSTKSRDKWLLSEQSGEPPDDAELSAWTDQFNVTGLPTGTYVAWIADTDAQRYDARCFEVDERTFEYWVAVNAGARTRGKLSDFNPRHDRITHLRLMSGLRVHSRRYFTAGALVGYEHVAYEASTTPSWDEYDDIPYQPDGSVSLDYSRNGLLVGAFVGVDVPFCLVGRGGQIEGCKLYLRRLSWFIEAAILGNLGFIDRRTLPTALADEADVLDPDLDVALQGGVRILATPTARFGIVVGSQWTDITAILGSSRTPAGQTHPAAAFTFDYAWRWTVGFELSLARRAR